VTGGYGQSMRVCLRTATVSLLCVTIWPAVVLVGRQPAYADTGRHQRHITYTRWSSDREFAAGTRSGVAIANGALHIGSPAGSLVYTDPYGGGVARTYAWGRWTSPWSRPGFGLTQLIASWNAQTPGGTWLWVQARGRGRSGKVSSWDTLGRWAVLDQRFHRMSLGRQPDDLAHVMVDTLAVRSGVRLRGFQLRVTLLRRKGLHVSPTLRSIGAMVSRLPHVSHVPRSHPGVAGGRSMRVPRYSQMIHRGEYPKWDNGGEAWCSPTSTAMVLSYWHRGPTPAQYAWVNDSYRDPWVDYAARFVYDYRYEGTGNWPFNTAYAARFGLDTFVTRLRSLREAERFIKAGIPLVASIAFGPGELDGSPISSSPGHLLVIVGFTATGNVIVNDPAARSNRAVRRVYKRGQFENAWIPTTGGVVYVIHPASKHLPVRHGNTNW
jgi:hypothetical protein